MKTMQFLFVGIFLFFAEVFNGDLSVMAPLSYSLTSPVGSAKTCAIMSEKSYLNQLNNSRYNNFNSLKALKSDFKGRNVLTTTEQKSLTPISSPANWNNISQQGINNSMDDLATTFNYDEDDEVKQFSDDVKNIYFDTVFLLLHKIQSWLESNKGLKAIDYYLGYDSDTIDLINISMTELLNEKREKNVNIHKLESLFYYSCDIKHMDENETTVKDKFCYFMKLFKCDEDEILKKEELLLKQNLKENLKKIVGTTHASMGITIESMKMRILMDQPKNEIIDFIQNRTIDPTTKRSLNELVESYSTEIDGTKVNANHVSILGIIIADMFGYALNHFQLLSKLQKYDINDNDKITINEFSTFMGRFLYILVNRFFELQGEWNDEFVNAMYSVFDFLNIPNLTDEQEALRHEGDYVQLFGEKKTILNYYNKSERNEIVNNEMNNLMINALQQLLFTCNGERPDYWEANRWSSIVYQEETSSKEYLIDLVKNNKNNALYILDTLCCELTLGKEVYKKYDLKYDLKYPPQ